MAIARLIVSSHLSSKRRRSSTTGLFFITTGFHLQGRGVIGVTQIPDHSEPTFRVHKLTALQIFPQVHPPVYSSSLSLRMMTIVLLRNIPSNIGHLCE